MNILGGFADISLGQLVLVGGMALLASIIGGLAGYGTGALMPLVLVALVGAEPVVPIIAISAIFTNISRFVAYFRYADRRGIPFVWFGSRTAGEVKDLRSGEQISADPSAWQPPEEDRQPRVLGGP